MIHNLHTGPSLGAGISMAERMILISLDSNQPSIMDFQQDTAAGMTFKTNALYYFRGHMAFSSESVFIKKVSFRHL